MLLSFSFTSVSFSVFLSFYFTNQPVSVLRTIDESKSPFSLSPASLYTKLPRPSLSLMPPPLHIDGVDCADIRGLLHLWCGQRDPAHRLPALLRRRQAGRHHRAGKFNLINYLMRIRILCNADPDPGSV